ncbi:MAG: hypothetical protein QNJ64_14325 [Crocosphaera sp.]|nr:hypothetical protein [Crocosphaera sp.]
MFKYFLSMTALMVSVAGIGVSLAREEFRCYLGLSSPECNSSATKSISPMPIETKFEKKATQDNLETSTELTPKSTDSLENIYIQETEQKVIIEEGVKPNSKFISVEELSSIPENKTEANFDSPVSSGEDAYVGIPIEVQPFNGNNN